MDDRLNLPIVRDLAETLRAELGDALDDQTLTDMLEGETPAIDIANRLMREYHEASADARGARAQAKDLTERAQRREARAISCRNALDALRRSAGLKALKLATGTIAMRRNPQKLEILNEQEIPRQLCRFEPDRQAIKDALKQGESVPGAQLVDGGEAISVRVK